MARLSHLKSDGVPSNPAFSQAVLVSDAARTVYVGGENGIGPDGTIVANPKFEVEIDAVAIADEAG